MVYYPTDMTVVIHLMYLVVADNRTIPYIYLLDIVIQKKILILCSVSLNMIVVLFQRYEFLISGQRQYMEKPKRTGGGGRTGEARKDEVSLLPLGLHYPYRYSIVTTRTFPIGIRFTSRTKISYYTIIV